MSAPVHVTTRDDLLFAVSKALPKLRNEEHREAVWTYTRKAERVAVGAWNLDGCRCPVSAVGIDRCRDDAQAFASEFDARLDVHPDEPIVLAVVDPPTASSPPSTESEK